MDMIIKKVTLMKGFNDWIGDRNGEMIIEENGREVYISISDVGEDALYYVTNKSIIKDLISCKNSVDNYLEMYEFGDIDEYKDEKKMKKSKYYDCFKYLYSLLDEAGIEVSEYAKDYGKSINEVGKLDSIKHQNTLQ